MAWVHLVGNGIPLPGVVAAAIGDHTRFAAGAFVLLSGAGVRAAYGNALASGGAAAREAGRRLWSRVLLLLVLDRLLAVGMALVNRHRRYLPGGEDPSAPLWPFAVFGEPGVTGGLLLLYALLLAAVPAATAVARRTGGTLVVGGSLAFYGVAHVAGNALHWPPWTFPVLFWQPFFVIGWLLQPALGRLWRLGGFAIGCWAAVALALYFGGQWLRYGGPWPADAPLVPVSWDFTKVPLRPAELVRYLVAMQVVFACSALLTALWRRADRAMEALRCLGRHSLVVYSAHLFVEVPLVELAGGMPRSPFVGIVLLVVDALALVGVAQVADRLRRWHPVVLVPRLAFRLRVPVGGVVGAAAILASVLSLWTVHYGLGPLVSPGEALSPGEKTLETFRLATDETLEEITADLATDVEEEPVSAPERETEVDQTG